MKLDFVKRRVYTPKCIQEIRMEVTTKELRIQPGKIIDQVSIGQEITVTYRGKPVVKIVPFKSTTSEDDNPSIFGMWKNHKDDESVEEKVRNIRKGRQF